MNISKINKIGYLAAGLGLILFLSRILPHPPNFTASLAVILFSATILRSYKVFLTLLVSYLMADIIINNIIYSQHEFVWFTSGLIWILLPFVLIFISLIFVFRNPLSPLKLLGSSIGASTAFFIISNFGVWIGSQILYTRDINGLILCYYNAIPFFMYEVAGTVFYTSLIFSLYWMYYNKPIHYEYK